MIPKCVLVLFASFFFRGECVPEDVVPTVEVPPTLSTTTDVFAVNAPGNREKLEEEIDKIGKDMQPDTAGGQEDLRIHDEFDLRNKLENFTVPKLSTTEKSTVKEHDPPIDGEGLEQEEAAPDPGDDGEHIRHPSEHDFGEFGDTLKDRRHSEPHEEEEIRSPPNPSPPDTLVQKENPASTGPVQEINQPMKSDEKPQQPIVSEIDLTGISSKVSTEVSETRYPGKTNNSEKETVVMGPPRPPPKSSLPTASDRASAEFQDVDRQETRFTNNKEDPGTETFAVGPPRSLPNYQEPGTHENLEFIPSEHREIGLPGIPGKDGAQFHTVDLGVKTDKLEMELSEIREAVLPGPPLTSKNPPTEMPEEKPYVPDMSFTGISTKIEQEISETRYPGKPEATEKEPVGPPRPPPRSKTVKPEKPEDVYPGPTGAADVEGPRIPSREGPEFQDPDRRKSEISSADIQGVDHPGIPISPTDEPEEEKYVPKGVDEIHDPRDFDREAIEGAKEMARRGEIEEEEEEEEDWIKWDLVHFLLLLSPYDKDEVTWWTIIFEAVKCSLRSCPQAKPHWHRKKMELPRVNRHRREHSEFDPEAVVQTTSKPCACQNLENYFEKLYESIGDEKKKEETSSSSNSTVIVNT